MEESIEKQFPIAYMDEMEKFLDDWDSWKLSENDSKNVKNETQKVGNVTWSRSLVKRAHLSVEQIFDLIMDVEKKEKAILPKRVKNTSLVMRDDFMDVLFFDLKIPGPITDREILQCRRWRFIDGNSSSSGFLLVVKSIELDEFPVKKKPIRAEVIMARRFLPRSFDGLARIESVMTVDFKGKLIPRKIILKLMNRLAGNLYDLKKAKKTLDKLEEDEETE